MASLLTTRATTNGSTSTVCLFCDFKASQRHASRFRTSSLFPSRPFASQTGFIKRGNPTSPFAISSTHRPLNTVHRRVRHFQSSARHLQQAAPKLAPSKTANAQPDPSQPVRPQRPNRPHIRAIDGELQPSPLSRPLGLPHPPQSGENTGIDYRGWRQRRDDFVSYDKHLERRRGLMKDLYEKNYFRDIGNLGKIHKGKSMLSPSTPFRKDVALWFPNLRGRTLIKGVSGDTEDTTPVLRGRVSVVCVMNSQWGEEQTKTFVGEKEAENPGLMQFLKNQGPKETAQIVQVNVEENWLKWGLIRMFFGRLRRSMPATQWGKYFLVKRGLSDDIKNAMGIWNMKVGYVYLVDGMCKVRWAGNGNARDDEKKSLLNSLRRLVDEARGVQRTKVTREEPRQTARVSLSEQRVASAAGA